MGFFSPLDNIAAIAIVKRIRVKIIRVILYCITLCSTVEHNGM